MSQNADIRNRAWSRTMRRKLSAPSRAPDYRVEFFEYSTLHGLGDLYRAKNKCLRLLWMCFFFGALVAAVYGCYTIIAEFNRSPVVVSYFVRESKDKKMTLPDVVICPFNRFNRSFFEEYNISNDLSQYLELSFPSPVMFDFQKREFLRIYKKLDSQQEALDLLLLKMGNISFSQFVDKATLNCKAIIQFHNSKPRDCAELDTLMTSAGKCLRVPGKDQEGYGFGYGLQMVLTLPHQLYNPGVNQLLIDGVAVKLVEKNKGIDSDLTFVPVGVHAILPLKATRYEFMDVPGKYQCDSKVNETYSRVWCFDLCLTEEAENFCQCSVAASAVPRQPLCTTKMFFNCFAPQLRNKSVARYTECRKRCRAPCKYWQYEGTVSYAKLPSPEARAFFTKGKEEETWNRLLNTIVLEVFYEHLEYTVIKHVMSMTPGSFIAQIGGQVSLWVGGSVLTLAQVIIFLANVLYRCSRGKGFRKKWESLKEKDNGINNSYGAAKV